jgi:ubiquinone/menaquinone biosynthesis C-methylase UbiE
MMSLINRYKRKLFLQWLDSIDFSDKSVLEVGSGPGGNLKYLSSKNCKELAGVDISSKMIGLAKTLLKDTSISLYKIDGTELPFQNNKFDIVFTSTVLQHNTDQAVVNALVKSICRVANGDIIIFERIEKKIKGHESNTGRPVEYYSALFKENNFSLIETKFLKIQASYYVCGIIRKIFNRKTRKEGETISKTSCVLQRIALFITKPFDKIIPSRRDLGMLHFRKTI